MMYTIFKYVRTTVWYVTTLRGSSIPFLSLTQIYRFDVRGVPYHENVRLHIQNFVQRGTW
jgi:hypothetical protein